MSRVRALDAMCARQSSRARGAVNVLVSALRTHLSDARCWRESKIERNPGVPMTSYRGSEKWKVTSTLVSRARRSKCQSRTLRTTQLPSPG
jgi:hypothetical protein